METVRNSIYQWWEKNAPIDFDASNPQVRLHDPTFGPDEISAMVEQLLSTRVTMGPVVKAFEQSFCDLLGYKHGVSNNSGSSANLLMISALTNPLTEGHLKPGDEVILPALTWSTSLWPLTQRGLVPVFVDSCPKTLNILPEAIEKAITDKTKAIMAVPVYGNPCDMDAIVDICQKHDLTLIEDCCESMGATYDGKAVGSFGRVASFSFYYSHHITTLEGGICLTSDHDLAEAMRIIRAHGWVRQTEDPEKWLEKHPGYDPKFLFVNEGYNLRLTEPQASMGLVQIGKLSNFVKARQKNAAFFMQALEKYSDIFSFHKTTAKAEHSWFGFTVMVNESAPFSRDEIRHHLESNGIETRPIIAGNLALQPGTKLFPHRVAGSLDGANTVMDQGFSFACHQSLTEEAKAYVVHVLSNFIDSKKGSSQ